MTTHLFGALNALLHIKTHRHSQRYNLLHILRRVISPLTPRKLKRVTIILFYSKKTPIIFFLTTPHIPQLSLDTKYSRYNVNIILTTITSPQYLEINTITSLSTLSFTSISNNNTVCAQTPDIILLKPPPIHQKQTHTTLYNVFYHNLQR